MIPGHNNAPVQTAHHELSSASFKKKSKYSLLSKMMNDSNPYFQDDVPNQQQLNAHLKDGINESRPLFKV